jgi:hypothetical protein
MIYKSKYWFAAVALLVSASLAQAQTLVLDPGVPLTLFTTNSNDGYNPGRGVVIQDNSPITITAVGLFTQPPASGFNPTWTIWQTTSYPSSNVNNILLETVTPGTQGVNGGLAYYDTTLTTPITLVPGNLYHFQISYVESAQQNWFYNFNLGNNNIGAVSVLDGTLGGDDSNTVMPGMRLQLSAAVPEPTTLSLMGITSVVVGGSLWIRRKRKLRRRLS